MKSIIHTLLNGSGTERLEVVANIITIAGVLAAAIFAPIIAVGKGLSFSSYMSIGALGFLYLSVLLLIIGFAMAMSYLFQALFEELRAAAFISAAFIWLLALAFLMLLTGEFYGVITNTAWS